MRRMRAVAPRLPRWISVVLGRVKVVPPRRALGFYFAPIAAVLAARHFLVGAFLPDVSSVGHPSIARDPRLVLGFFVFPHFGFQVAFASPLRGLPCLPPRLARLVGWQIASPPAESGLLARQSLIGTR